MPCHLFAVCEAVMMALLHMQMTALSFKVMIGHNDLECRMTCMFKFTELPYQRTAFSRNVFCMAKFMPGIDLLLTRTGIDSGTLLTCMSPQLVQWLKMGCQGGPTHHAPYIASPSVVSSNHQAAIESNSDAADSCANLWHKLTAACICCQVPYPDVAVLITCRQQLYAGTECQQRDLC